MRKNLVFKNGCELDVVGAVKGLSTERETVRESFRREPALVAISISPEELKGLRQYKDEHYILSDYEEIYADNLCKFGDVEIPPPCYTEALRMSNDKNIPIYPIDMSEQSFTNAYCAYISGTDLLRHSLRKSLLRHSKIKAGDAEEFVFKWDKKINRISGFRRLENRREKHMADRLASHSEKFKRILAVIELERAPGVIAKLGDSVKEREQGRNGD